jgi:hypothetical protein
MAKKQHHTYNVGDIVTFKFLTGDILTGKIVNHTYKENGAPDYKIRVEDSRGFTIYPCMTDERIIKRNKTALAVMKAAENKQKNKAKKIKNTELNKAIDAQKKFLGND